MCLVFVLVRVLVQDDLFWCKVTDFELFIIHFPLLNPAQYAGFVNGTVSGDNTLHYWFAEAENKWTKETPFLVWLNGGPVRALMYR